MPKPTRLPPRMGSRAQLTHFGGEIELATVIAVHDGGRHLEVSCQDGERAEFVLSEATAKFVATGWAAGAQLQLLD